MPEELKKTLSFPVILLITINSIMGTGIFFLPAVGARIAGPASLIAWLILSAISIYIAMIFAELSSMFPKSGGIYEFCKQAYGRFPSFIIGWTTIITGNITIAMLIVGAIRYLIPFEAPVLKIIISLGFIFIFNYIAYRGMKTSSTMLVAFAIITMGTLFSLIVPGLFTTNIGNFSPFFVFPFSATFLAIFFIAETFFGWETATFLAGETKDGQRVMPKALIISTVIIAVVATLFVFTSLNSINWKDFGGSIAPLTELGMIHFGIKGKDIFTIAVYLSIIGSVAGWIVSSPRLLLSMAQDKLFLTHLSKIHPKYNTPSNAIIFQTILTSILIFVGSGSYEMLLELLVPLVLLLYGTVIFSLVVLRKNQPDTPRYYKVPFAKVGPYLIILFIASMITIWLFMTPNAFSTLKLAMSFIAFGIPIYFLIEIYYDPKAITEIKDLSAYFALFTERINMPRKVINEILFLLGNIKGKSVLEYGCGVGTLTQHLAKEVGPTGKIHAVDLSINDLRITEKRMERLMWSSHERIHARVHTIHDENQVHRIHPDIPYVDAVVSVGNLGYIQDINKILKDIHNILPDQGKVCFVEYGDFFKIIPNIEWLSHNEVIQDIFLKNGFSVRVIRKKGIFWNYIYVYGFKSIEGAVPYI